MQGRFRAVSLTGSAALVPALVLTLVPALALVLPAAPSLAAPAPAGAGSGSGHASPAGARASGSSQGLPSVTISPLDGASAASPRTQISFLGAPQGDLKDVSVVGSKSGRHSGQLRPYAAAPGASFLPSRPFTPGERVSVNATVSSGGHSYRISSSFEVAYVAHLKYGAFPPVKGSPADEQSFHSTDIKPPTVTVNRPAGDFTAPGDLFATPALGPAEHGPMIFESSGRLVWFDKLAPGLSATDLKVKRYEGHEDLVWWQGQIVSYGFGIGEDVIANSSYETVAKVTGGNGVKADLHDLQLLGDGAALITAYEPVRANLSSVKGGSKHGIALDAIMQEVDVKTGLVMWEWDSIGHVAFSESRSPAPKTPAMPYDYFHINSVQALPNGNFLISARNTWAAYELNRFDGRIVWQIGGKHPTWRFGKHARFAWQHHVRMLSNGEITVFDDEGAPQVGPHARGELLQIDRKSKTVKLVGAKVLVREPQPLQTGSQGDVQPVGVDNWMVGWGGLPNFTEFDGSGKVVYDAQFPEGEMSYRVYRFPWTGTPKSAPEIAASSSAGTTTVWASWNGATGVASWQLLAGPSEAALSPAGTVAADSFEATLSTPAAAYVQVQALGGEGKVLAASKVIAPVSE